jgi:hypothetical protein
VTISVLAQLASELGFATKFVRLPITEIPDTAALFRSNTMGGVRPVNRIENRVLERNEKIEKLFLNAYSKYAEEESLYLHIERGVVIG